MTLTEHNEGMDRLQAVLVRNARQNAVIGILTGLLFGTVYGYVLGSDAAHRVDTARASFVTDDGCARCYSDACEEEREMLMLSEREHNRKR